MFKKFAETPLTLWIAPAVVVALCVIFAALVKTRRKWNARMLASGALCVALSFVLSCIRLYRMPTGGSVTPGSMLPLMLFSVAYGAGPGLLAGPGIRRAAVSAGRLVAQCLAVPAGLHPGLYRAGPGGHCP